MLQITLDSTAKQNVIQSAKPNDWGFKLQVVNEGDSTELRVSFFEESNETNSNLGYETLPGDNNIIGDSNS
jgi:hypothetical protein